VNGDGKPDLIVVDEFGNKEFANGTVGVLLGNGDGTFQPVVTYGSGGFTATGVAVADVNGDGKPDIVVTNCDSGSSPSIAGEKLDYRVTKMRLSKDKTSLIYNQFLTLSEIPKETYG
jgi:FG-GAP-like repeat